MHMLVPAPAYFVTHLYHAMYVCEYPLVTHHCLHQKPNVNLSIIVVSGIVLRSNNKYVGLINCTSSLWETTPNIKSINYIFSA